MASELTVEALGLSRDEITERVVQRIAESLMSSTITKFDDGEAYEDARPTPFADQIAKKVTAKVNEAIDQIAGKHVLPNVASYVETLCLQETNKWGEKTGKALTFTEYLVARANAYLTEEVDFRGKTKSEEGYGWKKNTTRVAYLVHEHLQYSIETVMKAALTDANSKIVGGIEAAIKIKLAEVAASLKVQVRS
jgi:hypothetical protein